MDNLSVEFKETEALKIQVNDLNHIPSYKIAEEERRKNELQRIANENERITNENERETYYNEFQGKVNSGYFDGASGVYVGSEEPTDEDINVWIDPNGTPEVEASNIVFADSESLQTKYENGELKGEKGDKGADGTMSFTDLTEEQKASLKGEKGDTGEQGIQGIQGEKGADGYTPVKGVDYFTEEDIASLNIPDLYSNDETVVGTWTNNKPIYRKTIELSTYLDSTGSYQSHNFTLELENIDRIWLDEAHSFWVEHLNTLRCPITYINPVDDISSGYYIKVSSGVPTFEFRKSSGVTVRGLYITVEYTKTTD